MTPTVGATYETARGIFKVVSTGRHHLVAERADLRRVALALADWETWNPVLCPTPPDDHNI